MFEDFEKPKPKQVEVRSEQAEKMPGYEVEVEAVIEEAEARINDQIQALELLKQELQDPQLRQQITSIMRGEELMTETTIPDKDLRTEIAEAMVEKADTLDDLFDVVPRLMGVLDTDTYNSAYENLATILKDSEKFKRMPPTAQEVACKGITRTYGLRGKVLTLLSIES